MAAEKPGNNAEQAPAVAPSGGGGGGGSKLTMIIAVVNLLATLGMIAVLVISFQKQKSHVGLENIDAHGDTAHGGGGGEHGEEASEHGEGEASPPKPKVDFGKMVTLEQFTVNLSTPGSVNPKFVRVNISLKVPNEDTELEVNSKMPQIRNVVIDLINSRRPADLANADGREYLKEEIRTALNSFLTSGKVDAVYFTSFALAG